MIIVKQHFKKVSCTEFSYISLREPKIIKFNKFFKKIWKIKKWGWTMRTIIVKMNVNVSKISEVFKKN